MLLGDFAVLLGRLDPALHLLDHVEVVLDVLERAPVGQLLEQGFYFLLGNTYSGGPDRGRLPSLAASWSGRRATVWKQEGGMPVFDREEPMRPTRSRLSTRSFQILHAGS